MLMVAYVQSNWNLLLKELSRWKQLSSSGTLSNYSTTAG
jgi:hypothetical protein